jgi:hypothetical protein
MGQWTTGRTNYGVRAQWRCVKTGLSLVLMRHAICDLDLDSVNVGRKLG